ncbi:MAG TPA: hypothetical protein VMV53_03330 [Acidimicrobiales bacterium]|nr:hypothetical protein [Acidimicrobiales bacterium]
MFIVVFTFFVLAVVVLSVLTLRWAIGRDHLRRSSAAEDQSDNRS